MGGQAHLLRLAMGRSADMPPEWEFLVEQWHVKDRDMISAPKLYVRTTEEFLGKSTYDEKGRAIDATARQNDQETCKSQNEVLKTAVAELCDDEEPSTITAMRNAVEAEGTSMVDHMKIVSTVLGQVDHFARCWLDVVFRSLFLDSRIGTLSFGQIVNLQFRRCNTWAAFRLPYSYATARIMDIVENIEAQVQHHILHIGISKPQLGSILDKVVPYLISFGQVCKPP